MNGVEAGNYIQEERLSFRELIEKFQTFFKYLISQWLKIGVVAIMVSASYFFYRYYKSPTYIAETTFVLDAGENGGGMGQLSSLASVVGVNLGGLGEDNGLFQMDNISALYSSRTMLKQAFLSSCTIDSTP
ncbi:MAG: hypothetical protein OEY56_10535, partial [Cyclobacteriaceae bacterium]|nr:hypothetical protein [Cyclobacteriaceae bacterium]